MQAVVFHRGDDDVRARRQVVALNRPQAVADFQLAVAVFYRGVEGELPSDVLRAAMVEQRGGVVFVGLPAAGELAPEEDGDERQRGEDGVLPSASPASARRG